MKFRHDSKKMKGENQGGIEADKEKKQRRCNWLKKEDQRRIKGRTDEDQRTTEED